MKAPGIGDLDQLGVRLHIQETEGSAAEPRRLEPVRLGVPWPRGVLRQAESVRLVREQGESLPIQTRSLDLWPDGSIRWTLVDFLASTHDSTDVFLQPSTTPDSFHRATPLSCSSSAEGRSISIDTGPVAFSVAVGRKFPLSLSGETGSENSSHPFATLQVLDEEGEECQAEISAVKVVEEGPIRASVEATGHIDRPQGGMLCRLRVHFEFFAHCPTVRVGLTLTNPNPASHPGGKWSLGSDGSIYFRGVSVRLRLPSQAQDTEISISSESDLPLEPFQGTAELYQESSGGQQWRSPNHVNRNGVVPMRFRGYRLRVDGTEKSGPRATPVALLRSREMEMGVCVEHFWQNFPKAVEASDKELALQLFPPQFPDLHELQGGEQKTHTFYLSFGRDEITPTPLHWCRSPLFVRCAPDWYAYTQAIPRLTPIEADSNANHLQLIQEAVSGADSFAAKRERVDEYGWRHFGDLYADHEAARHVGAEPFVSHYNNQYDAIFGFGVQFLRSGDRRWFSLMDELTAHLIDIDIYHTDLDKSAYNHGLFWHTDHYVEAGTSTHRSFPVTEGVSGGGPSPAHLYTGGLLLHYFLTGSEDSKSAVIQLGKYVIDADDGTRSALRFLDRGFTGHVSENGLDRDHGPGRSSANSIESLLNSHRLTHDPVFLEKAEQLIRRCIHPHDDLVARRLGDAEDRWYYTVFLQALGRYLDYKVELGQLDFMFQYARASLLHYSDWAAHNERPYLENPEELEFPTETWAAQDMRKSEVFKIAAKYAPRPDFARYADRAREFFDVSLAGLAKFPSRTSCRPLILMLTFGYWQASFDRSCELAPDLPESHPDFGKPSRFVPQRERAKRKLLLLTLLFAASTLTALGLLIL